MDPRGGCYSFLAEDRPVVKLLECYGLWLTFNRAIAAVGGGWNYLKPFHRPFSLVDLSISFPFEKHETIPTWLLVLVGLIIPAFITFIVALVFVPGPTASRGTPKSLIWRRKLWEWNTAWSGLGLSLATAFMVTQGMKLLFGKPRPDLLSRCQPRTNAFGNAAVSSYGTGENPLWVLVTSDICTQTDDSKLQDGFKSFPSGHASCELYPRKFFSEPATY
jgi:membrane-associated phospholipid phosphatase